MSAGTRQVDRDAFGVGSSARLLRRLVAAALAVWVFATGFSVFFFAASHTFAVVAAFVFLLPLSYVLEWRWPGQPGRPSLVRYGLVGALLGWLSLVVVLQAPPSRGWAAMAIVVGALAAGLGVWIAAVLPARWVGPAGVLAVALTVAISAIT